MVNSCAVYQAIGNTDAELDMRQLIVEVRRDTYKYMYQLYIYMSILP